MRFGVLGPLAVWTADGRPVRVPELKVRALLADLLVQEGRPVSPDRLVDDLWGEDLPGNPTNTLQTKVSQLRRALEKAEPGGRDLVTFQTAGYILRADPEAVDARRFADLTAKARATSDPRMKADLLSDALALWRGPALADFRDEEFARPAITRLEEQRLTALEERAEVRLDLGEHSLLADELSELVAQHPLRERLRAGHLRALYRTGRQSEALDGYSELRERLADDLGLDPSPELVALHQAILEQDPSLSPVPPPPTSTARRHTNLPAPLTDLIGRDEEITRVRTLLGSARLVTLAGPGGVGKTRLALATAAQMSADFPDGVWLVELAGLRRPETVPEAIAEAIAAELGLRDETAIGSRPGVRPAGLTHRLADALRARKLLLVLDNCEHLINPVAELAGLLLRDAPDLHVLATSQEPLTIPGEILHPVTPLDLPSAVRLFTARATSTTPGFVLDSDTAPWVEAICRRLDGLPLALELAATRVRALGVRDLAERLDDRFRLLSTGSRGLPARQQTLRAVIDWSWEQLTEPQRTVLRRLAVHLNGATLEAAEAVCSDPDLDPADIADLLGRLVDRSMVVHDGARYRLLETVAAYSLEQLHASGEFATVKQRHTTHYTEFAERANPHLYGHNQREWLQRLDAEALNMRSALTEAGDSSLRLVNALAWYWFLRGRHTEAHRSLTTALALPSPPSEARSTTTAWQTGFAILTGDGTDRANPEGPPRTQWFLALAHLHFGDIPTGKTLIDQTLPAFRTLNDRWGEAAALSSRARQAVLQADFPTAKTSSTESLALFTELGDRWGQLQATDMLGYLAEIAGDYAEAARLHRDGLRTAEDLQLWTDVSYRLSSLGRIALLTGDFAKSKELHQRAMRLAAEQSNQFAEEFARVGLGLVARRSGDLDAAEALFQTSLTWNQRLKADYGIPFYGVTLLLAELGFIAELRGNPDEARALHLQGLTAAQEVGDPRAIALATEGLAGAAAISGQHDEAAQLLQTASDLRQSVGAPLPPAERGDVDRITAAMRGPSADRARP